MGVIKRTEEEIFCKDSEVSQETLRSHYIRLNKTYKCNICGINEWQNQPITLRLDHIDGDNHNNVLSNLRWLCPNCDSQQETYCGKNKKHYIEKPKKYCIVCGKEIPYDTKTNYCGEHWNTIGQPKKIADRPSRDELKNMIRTMPFTTIASKYGVCDNTIRKWCKAYSLPTKKTEIIKFSDSFWETI